jgi:cytochrome c553
MKLAVVIAAAGLAGAGALFATDLVDYYRFGKALDSTIEASQADAGPWPRSQETCFLCHGPSGQSRNRDYPALAGQPAAYLEAQLRAFASGLRPSATMGPLARHLDDGQIQAMAAYYARQVAARSEEPPADAALEARGRAAVQARSCQACHGEGLMGKDLAPRLAGLGQGYLTNELAAFKTGERRDAGGVMNGVAAALAKEDIPALAHYLAAVSPARPHGVEAR